MNQVDADLKKCYDLIILYEKNHTYINNYNTDYCRCFELNDGA